MYLRCKKIRPKLNIPKSLYSSLVGVSVSCGYFIPLICWCGCTLYLNGSSAASPPPWNFRGGRGAPPIEFVKPISDSSWFIVKNEGWGGGGGGWAFIPSKIRGHSFPRGWFVWFIWRNDRIASVWVIPDKNSNFWECNPLLFLKERTFGAPL